MNYKILHVYRTYFPDPPGGVQEAIKQIAEATKIYGIESRIFTLSPSPIPQIIERSEGRVIRSRSWAAPASCDLGGLNALKRFREEVDWADLIQYHYPWPFADVLHLVTRVGKPAVMTYHSDIVRQRILGSFYAPLMKHMLGSMRAVVATSPAYALTSNVLNSYVTPERLKTIPLGIADYHNSLVCSNAESAFLDRCFVRDKPFVLALGAMRYYKGFHTLVEAALAINATVVIAGSGPEEHSLKQLAVDKGVKNIIFVGQISEEEKIYLLKNCSVFALPSHLRSEAFGMVLIEASMFSKPMVCCEIGSGTSYINLHNKTGLVVKPESPQNFSDAVNFLLSNKWLAVQMGLEARKRYEQLFSDVALGREYSKLYLEVCNKISSI